MAFAGIRGTGSFGADERPKNFREYILWKNPNGSAPLTALLARIASERVDDPEFAWFEEALTPTRVQINNAAGYNNTATTLTIYGNGLSLVPNDLLLVEKTEAATYDNEVLIVQSVTNDTTIVVKRGAAGTTAASIPHQSYLTKLGSSHMQGSGKAQISLRNPVKKRNYTQIFKTSVGVTRTATQTRFRTGDPYANDKRRKAFDHSVAMEMQFLFGVPYEDLTTTPHPTTYTGGLRHFITTNVTVFTTQPTEDTFLDAVYKIWDFNTEAGNERIAFCGNGFLNSLNRLARKSASTRINFDGTVDVYGMKLTKWVFPQGVIAFRTHPLLNLHGRYTNSCFIIDPSNLKYRYLQDTHFVDNIQSPDVDGREGQWITECGLEVHAEETMAYIGNFIVT